MRKASPLWNVWIKSIFLFSLLALFSVSYALPFTIVPKAGTTLPTSVGVGQLATAYYTVFNNTNALRINNFTKYLPPNVFQITSGGTYPDTCGVLFNLARKGQTGDSCTLQLIISGAVNANDPNPHHHLFVCFPGGITCAGTLFPLNVVLTPTPPPVTLISLSVIPSNVAIVQGAIQQYTAIGTFSNGSMQDLTSSVIWVSSNTNIATITNGGLATGIVVGSSVISATVGSIIGSTTLRVLKQVAYVANNSNDSTISICPVIQAGGSLGPCTAFNDPTFHFPADIILNSTATVAYVANTTTSTISVCPVNPDGSLNPCQAAPAEATRCTGLRLNAANTLLYYTQCDDNAVAICPVNANGSLGTCISQPQFFGGPDGRISLNAAGNLAYISEDNTNSVTICTVNPNGSLGRCSAPNFDPTFMGPLGTAIDPTNTFLYVTNFLSSSAISICPINPDGSLQPCTSSTGNNMFNFSNDSSTNIFIQNINGISYAYVPNGGSSSPTTVSICNIQSNGSFGTCNAHSDATFDTPDGVWIANLSQ